MEQGVETIAAIATAQGQGGVGIVRVSGPDALAISRTLLGHDPSPRYAHFATFKDEAGEVIDQGLLLFFPGPHSFTGEDVAEFQVHGSQVVLDWLLGYLCRLGARLARAGEFSERAFLNGKMDLTQAEAVADLVAARSEQAARSAQRSLQGVFSDRVNQLLDELIALRVHIEAAIDFPEEEIDFLADPAIMQQLLQAKSTADDLLQSARRGVRLADGLNVAIVGRPNVGKSSLLNQLAGDDRAIVTDLAGTTRDVLRETLLIDGVSIELVDTAGLRNSHDPIEKEGIRRAHAHLEQADIALLVTDEAERENDLALLDGVPQTVARLVVVNKIDLTGRPASRQQKDQIDWLYLSAKTGEGMEPLREALKCRAGVQSSDGNGAFSARKRHVLSLEQTCEHLAQCMHVLNETKAGELAAEELHQAQQTLGEVTGVFYPDDLLGAIFSSFCVGK